MQFINTSDNLRKNIQAEKDMWLIGASFLQEVYSTLADMKTQASNQKQPMPYIFEYYNVSSYTQHPFTAPKNVLLQMTNELVKGLNEHVRLPRMIVVIPDWDILRFIDHFAYGVSTVTGICLHWVINNMEHYIEARKDELRRKKLGAVTPNEPKIIWVMMFNRVNGTSKMLAVRKKYNTVLEELLSKRRYHYVLDVSQAIEELRNFTHDNQLNMQKASFLVRS